MRGGRWNYAGPRIEEILTEMGNDTKTMYRFPRLSHILIELSVILYDIEHDLDWDFSGDSSIENDSDWETAFINKLREALGAKREIKDVLNSLDKLQDRLIRLRREVEKSK